MLNGHIRESFEQIRRVSGRINHLSLDPYASLLAKLSSAFGYDGAKS